jgi:LacI family transcriptional regulator
VQVAGDPYLAKLKKYAGQRTACVGLSGIFLGVKPAPGPQTQRESSVGRKPSGARDRTSMPRVLVVLDTFASWSRGILRGFVTTAHERGWTLLHYTPQVDLSWVAEEWAPDAALIGPGVDGDALALLRGAPIVSVTVDRTAAKIASVCLDERRIGDLALQHLFATGLRHVSSCRYNSAPFAVDRERGFVEAARAAGLNVAVGWGSDEAVALNWAEDPAVPRLMPLESLRPTAMREWLLSLPKPCGVFTCTDGWARAAVRCARVAGLRVPEDIAFIGADNDALECELMAPPLSSVMIPWQEVGRSAASLVQLALSRKLSPTRRLTISPLAVQVRRSTDILAVEDELVARAVRWIRTNLGKRLTVSMVATAVGTARQRLERRFRRVLGRTIKEEIQRRRVEIARGVLQNTSADLPEVARLSGFTTAALLNAAFRRELGMPPGVYRRRLRQELSGSGDD